MEYNNELEETIDKAMMLYEFKPATDLQKANDRILVLNILRIRRECEQKYEMEQSIELNKYKEYKFNVHTDDTFFGNKNPESFTLSGEEINSIIKAYIEVTRLKSVKYKTFDNFGIVNSETMYKVIKDFESQIK